MNLKEVLRDWFDSTFFEDEQIICNFFDTVSSKESSNNFEWDEQRSILTIKFDNIEKELGTDIHFIKLHSNNEFEMVYKFIQEYYKFKDIEEFDDYSYQLPPEEDVREWCESRRKKYVDEINEGVMNSMYPEGYDPDIDGMEFVD